MNAGLRFHVLPTSGVPIYRQLMDQVRNHIAAGRLAADDFLPSVRQTALQLSVNPMTVSKAYSLLEREGVLENVRGQGMRVAHRAVNGQPLRERREELVPLLRQVVAKAYELDLSAEQVAALLESLLKERKR